MWINGHQITHPSPGDVCLMQCQIERSHKDVADDKLVAERRQTYTAHDDTNRCDSSVTSDGPKSFIKCNDNFRVRLMPGLSMAKGLSATQYSQALVHNCGPHFKKQFVTDILRLPHRSCWGFSFWDIMLCIVIYPKVSGGKKNISVSFCS